MRFSNRSACYVLLAGASLADLYDPCRKNIPCFLAVWLTMILTFGVCIVAIALFSFVFWLYPLYL
jgi:hypothetical protein